MTTRDAIKLVRVRRAVHDGTALRLRKAAGLSQAEVAAAIGCSQAAVARWERGERSPRGTTALRYGKLLDQLEVTSRASAVA